MKHKSGLKKWGLLLVAGALVITVSFAQTSAGKSKALATDTVPKKQKKVRDLDEALAELDKGEADMQKAMQEVDAEKIEREVRVAMKGLDVDMAKVKEELTKVTREIDRQKINEDMQKGLAEAQKALKEIDVEKIKADVQASLAKVDMEKVKAEIEKLKEVDMTKMKKELEDLKPQMEKAMQEAKKDMQKARAEITAYKTLVNALEQDGYLKKDENYKVEYKNGQLTVNGKTLSADAVKKYSNYLSGKKDFTIQKDEDNFNINNK